MGLTLAHVPWSSSLLHPLCISSNSRRQLTFYYPVATCILHCICRQDECVWCHTAVLLSSSSLQASEKAQLCPSWHNSCIIYIQSQMQIQIFKEISIYVVPWCLLWLVTNLVKQHVTNYQKEHIFVFFIFCIDSTAYITALLGLNFWFQLTM